MRLPVIPRGMRVVTWPPVLATRGPGSAGVLHAHHGLHFVLAVEGEIRVRATRAGRWARAAGVLTAPDTPHAIDGTGGEVLLVFLDPESHAGAAFRPALARPVRLLSPEERDALVRDVVPRTLLETGAEAWVREAARTLGVAAPSPGRVHPRVRRLLALLRASGIDDVTSLAVLAERVGLSPGRLMHAFTASIGIPLRPYLGWLRVQRAAVAIVTGHPLVEAAYAAGFSDAAHMSRTFTRMLGVPPSRLRPMRCTAPGELRS